MLSADRAQALSAGRRHVPTLFSKQPGTMQLLGLFFLMRFLHQIIIFYLLASSYLSCLLTYVMGISFGH